MMTTTRTRLSAGDSLRKDWYLLRFGYHMQDFPNRRYKPIRAELSAQLDEAAAHVGMRQAVADLGHPAALAEQYVASLGRRLPRWTTGAVAAGLSIGILVFLGMSYAFGTLDTLDALGGGTRTAYPFGAPTTFVNDGDSISVESTFTLAGAAFFTAVAVVSFVLGSRVWRLIP